MGSLAEPLEQLQTELQRRLADANIHVDAPSSPDGAWWVDIEREGNVASVEWRPRVGFGVAGPDGGYGEGPDVVVNDAVLAADHVARLLERRSGPTASELQELVDEFQRNLETMSAHIDEVYRDLVTQQAEAIGPQLQIRMKSVISDVHQVESKFVDLAKVLLAARPQRYRGPIAGKEK
jgi:hypothetical protein